MKQRSKSNRHRKEEKDSPAEELSVVEVEMLADAEVNEEGCSGYCGACGGYCG